MKHSKIIPLGRSTIRLHEKIHLHIKSRIKQGEWRTDEKLPSIRHLALEYHVHRLTVWKAFQLLKEEKLVYVREKSGYYVQPNPSTDDQDLTISQSTSTIRPLSEIQQESAIYQFSKALIDPNLLPNHYFSDYLKKVFDIYPRALSTYSPVQGDEELRNRLTHYFQEQFGFYLSSDEILITTGGQQAIDLIARIYIQPGYPILIESPTYSAAIDLLKGYGAQLISIDIGPDGYDLQQVEHAMQTWKPRLFYLNPTFHNPTGYTVPTKQRKQLVELAEQYDCILIEDDPFRDIYFQQEPPPPLFTYDTSGSVIYIRSFSKYIAPGLRIAAVACRSNRMKQLLSAKSLADYGTPYLNQKIFLHYFFAPRLQQHLEKLRIALQIRKEMMEKELMATNWEWASPTGGLNLWVKLPNSMNLEDFYHQSRSESIAWVPGIVCDPLRRSSLWIRLSYSYINEQQMIEGCRKLIDLYKSKR